MPKEHANWSPYDNNGGTCVAIAGADYCVIAADTRMSTGYSILTRDYSKICKLADKSFMASSGFQADVKALQKVLSSRHLIYQHQHNKQMSCPAMAQLLSNTLYYKRFFPYYAFNVLGGLDSEGKGCVFTYDAVGSYERVGYSAQGSGATLITPFLDNQLKSPSPLLLPAKDVTSKIISFSKYGPRAICVLSALGIISHVTLRQASSSGGTVTYEGRFEILSLSGSFTPGEVGGISSREGGMSIALSSPDGRVVGGLLGGLLTAAGPVQVVVASFLPDVGNAVGPKPRKHKNTIKLSTPVAHPTPPAATSINQQNFNEESQESPTSGSTNSTHAPNFQQQNHTPMATVHDWRRTATDMNVSLRDD